MLSNFSRDEVSRKRPKVSLTKVSLNKVYYFFTRLMATHLVWQIIIVLIVMCQQSILTAH